MESGGVDLGKGGGVARENIIGKPEYGLLSEEISKPGIS